MTLMGLITFHELYDLHPKDSFFPTQWQDISTSGDDMGAFPYIFISWECIHLTKIIWLGNSSLYAITMLVDISLHLLGQGSELISFNRFWLCGICSSRV